MSPCPGAVSPGGGVSSAPVLKANRLPGFMRVGLPILPSPSLPFLAILYYPFSLGLLTLPSFFEGSQALRQLGGMQPKDTQTHRGGQQLGEYLS